MKGDIGKNLKRARKVRSKDLLLKKKLKKGKNLIVQEAKNENLVKVTVVKTDSKNNNKVKSVNKFDNKRAKIMKWLRQKKSNQKKNKKTRNLKSKGVSMKNLENKEHKVADGKQLENSKVRPRKRQSRKRKLGRPKLTRSMKMRRKSRFSRLGSVPKVIQEAKVKDPLTLYAENDGSEVSPKKVAQAVKALLELLRDSEEKLFTDEGKDIYLYIKCIKIPMTPPREVRVVLPHSLLPEKPDVCLFSSDLQKGKRVDHEPTLEHVKNILSKHGVTEISEVITLKQLKTEYDQYELKRALCSRFDFFLSDAKVCGHIVHHLGKTFYNKRKIPVPIKLDSKKLKECVQAALHKTSFRLANNFVLNMKVAHTNMTPKQIEENIIAASAALHDCLPGGWKNVATLTIRGVWTLPVPFYVSTFKEGDVPKLDIGTRRPKAAKNVVGELEGVGYVRVTPGGNVDVIKQRTFEKFEKRKIVSSENEEEANPSQANPSQTNPSQANPSRKRKRSLRTARKKKQKSDESEVEDTNNASRENEDIEVDDRDEESDVESENEENENARGKVTGFIDDSENESSYEEGISAMEAAYLQELEKHTPQKTAKKKSKKNR